MAPWTNVALGYASGMLRDARDGPERDGDQGAHDRSRGVHAPMETEHFPASLGRRRFSEEGVPRGVSLTLPGSLEHPHPQEFGPASRERNKTFIAVERP